MFYDRKDYFQLVCLEIQLFSSQNIFFPDNYAVVLDVSLIRMQQMKSCDIGMMKEYFYPYMRSIGLQNNSVYNDPIATV